MRRIAAFIIAATALSPLATWAQGAPVSVNVVGTCGTPNSTYNTNRNAPATMDQTGKLCVNATVNVGSVTANTSATAASSLPTLGPGSTVQYQSLGGGLYVQPVFGSSAGGGTQVDSTHGLPVLNLAGAAIIGKVGIDQTTPGTTNGVQVVAALPAGTALIGKFGIDQTTPGSTNGVNVDPSAASTAGIVPTAAYAASSLVVKASAGNLWGYTATNNTGATLYIMVFNLTSAPADGAVTPAQCIAIPSGTSASPLSVGVSAAGEPPAYYSAGITIVASSTGCGNKTAIATTAITGKAS